MKTNFVSEILQAKSSTGKIKYWRGLILNDDDGKYYTSSESWVGDSKHKFSDPREAKPKNIGKTNETTSETQAKAELESNINKKKDSGYSSESQKNVKRLKLPMLAHDYNIRGHDLVLPCLAQPKYDGMRCLYNTKLKAYSRLGNPIVEECFKHLEFNTGEFLFDGELLLLGERHLEKSVTAFKSYKEDVTSKLHYVIYDVILDKTPYSERLRILTEYLNKIDKPERVIIAPTVELFSTDEFKAQHDEYVEAGYEGMILRNVDGLYTSFRSKDLLKYKTTITEEFQIIGAKEGEGRNKGCVCWKVRVSPDVTVDVNPKGSLEGRRKLWLDYQKDPSKYIDKLLTVKFSCYTGIGSLRNPVGITIRDYE
jgi:ATP-dependent DNA ligase